MQVYTWPETVNTKFFSMKSKPKENVKITEFMSGRTVGVQYNTKSIMTYACSLSFTNTELSTFWSWFNDTLGQTANAFTCDAIGNGYYRFTSIPEPQDTDQVRKVVTLEFEEVF